MNSTLTRTMDRDGEEHRAIPHRDDLLHPDDPAWRTEVASGLRAVVQRGRALLAVESR